MHPAVTSSGADADLSVHSLHNCKKKWKKQTNVICLLVSCSSERSTKRLKKAQWNINVQHNTMKEQFRKKKVGKNEKKLQIQPPPPPPPPKKKKQKKKKKKQQQTNKQKKNQQNDKKQKQKPKNNMGINTTKELFLLFPNLLT